MKIAHVVTYVDELGSFGGPTRVAMTQAAALAALGHEVTVFAAAPASQVGIFQNEEFILKNFEGKRLIGRDGFAFMRSPQLLKALRETATDFDVVHIHLARDLVTLPAAKLVQQRGTPYIAQTHGMIDASSKILAKPLDAFLTKRVLRGAKTVLVLTDSETGDLQAVEPKVVTERISNGIQVRELPPYARRKNMVLFLGRLQERKRPLAFVQIAVRLSAELPETEFVMVGPDEGEGKSVQQAIAESGMGERLRWIGATSPRKTDEWMASARVYVLPAVNEIFPMTIIEAIRSGTPVVTTDSLGIAADCQKYGAAIVTNGEPHELSEAVLRIMKDPVAAEELRDGGLNYLKKELDISAVAHRLIDVYQGAIV